MNSPYLIIDRSGNAVDINSTEPPTCHDHYRTCHGCPDRVADPCHGTCKGYIDRAAEEARKTLHHGPRKQRTIVPTCRKANCTSGKKPSAPRSWKKSKEGT